MRPLRLLALITDAYGRSGGVAQYNRDLIAALSASPRVESICVAPRLGEPAGSSPVPPKVALAPPVKSRLRYSARALQLAAMRGPFDAVFCGHILHAPLAYAVSRMLRRPMWVQVHGIDAWHAPSPLVRQCLERADLVTAVSRFTRHRVLQWAALSPQTVRVLPNTLRDSFFLPPLEAAFPDAHPLAGKEYILTVSRTSKGDYYKGHDRVISVLPELRRRHPELIYVVVGDGDARAELEAFAQRLGVADAVHFIGHIPTAEMQAVMRNARAFVMPSTKEGFGIVFLEAAASGIPVIAGNKDGSVDALADGALGTIIDPNSSDALMDAISAALDGRLAVCQPADLSRFRASNFRSHVDQLVGLLQESALRHRQRHPIAAAAALRGRQEDDAPLPACAPDELLKPALSRQSPGNSSSS